MKVVCIDDSRREKSYNGIPTSECEFPSGWVVKGEVYTVTSHLLGAYELAEKPIFYPKYKIYGAWMPHRFVPLDYYKAEFNVSEEKEQQDVVLR